MWSGAAMHEVGDHPTELLARVLLQEVPRTRSSPPPPSCRRPPAPRLAGWSRPAAPAMAAASTGAIGPVMGSPSLNAQRNGRSSSTSTDHAFWLATAPGSSGDVGTSNGNARAPAL